MEWLPASQINIKTEFQVVTISYCNDLPHASKSHFHSVHTKTWSFLNNLACNSTAEENVSPFNMMTILILQSPRIKYRIKSRSYLMLLKGLFLFSREHSTIFFQTLFPQINFLGFPLYFGPLEGEHEVLNFTDYVWNKLENCLKKKLIF